MKNLLFLIAVLISTTSIAQTYVKMDLPASMQSKYTTRTTTYETITKDVTVTSKDGKVSQKGKVRMVIPDKGEGLISMEFTENILTVGKFKADALVTASAKAKSSEVPEGLTACLAWCNENYTDANGEKIRGRGSCKFGCWLGTTIRVIEVGIKVIEVVSPFLKQ